MSSLKNTFASARIMVVGDVMLDRYWDGTTARISPEAPVPVVKVENTSMRIGGSGNVAANIASLGGEVELLATVGDDEAADSLEVLCRQEDIKATLIRRANRRTPVKLRVISQQQQLIRLDFESATVDPVTDKDLKTRFAQKLTSVEVAVLSDYKKGALADPQLFIGQAIDAKVRVIVDPKGRDFEAYRGAYLVTPNMSEFEAVVGPCETEDEIAAKGLQLLKRLDIGGLLVTRGEKGMSLIQVGEKMVTLDANAQEVYDVTGAGDTVCAVCAVALASGMTLSAAVEYANAAAGVVVSKLGTATVSVDELEGALNSPTKQAKKHLPLSDLVIVVQKCREKNQTIVMTNGCFDILHAGHVSYLQAARKLGDRLIVALNTDNSVRQLKGDGRPINSLTNRMTVLKGLECVDWVIEFDEQTPVNLINTLSPDVLVKGGDYEPSSIVGATDVLARGGRVEVLPFVEGLSTTGVIEKLDALEDDG